MGFVTELSPQKQNLGQFSSGQMTDTTVPFHEDCRYSIQPPPSHRVLHLQINVQQLTQTKIGKLGSVKRNIKILRFSKRASYASSNQ